MNAPFQKANECLHLLSTLSPILGGIYHVLNTRHEGSPPNGGRAFMGDHFFRFYFLRFQKEWLRMLSQRVDFRSGRRCCSQRNDRQAALLFQHLRVFCLLLILPFLLHPAIPSLPVIHRPDEQVKVVFHEIGQVAAVFCADDLLHGLVVAVALSGDHGGYGNVAEEVVAAAQQNRSGDHPRQTLVALGEGPCDQQKCLRSRRFDQRMHIRASEKCVKLLHPIRYDRRGRDSIGRVRHGSNGMRVHLPVIIRLPIHIAGEHKRQSPDVRFVQRPHQGLGHRRPSPLVVPDHLLVDVFGSRSTLQEIHGGAQLNLRALHKAGKEHLFGHGAGHGRLQEIHRLFLQQSLLAEPFAGGNHLLCQHVPVGRAACVMKREHNGIGFAPAQQLRPESVNGYAEWQLEQHLFTGKVICLKVGKQPILIHGHASSPPSVQRSNRLGRHLQLCRKCAAEIKGHRLVSGHRFSVDHSGLHIIPVRQPADPLDQGIPAHLKLHQRIGRNDDRLFVLDVAGPEQQHPLLVVDEHLDLAWMSQMFQNSAADENALFFQAERQHQGREHLCRAIFIHTFVTSPVS